LFLIFHVLTLIPGVQSRLDTDGANGFEHFCHNRLIDPRTSETQASLYRALLAIAATLIARHPSARSDAVLDV
jgi:hypothetical protein